MATLHYVTIMLVYHYAELYALFAYICYVLHCSLNEFIALHCSNKTIIILLNILYVFRIIIMRANSFLHADFGSVSAFRQRMNPVLVSCLELTHISYVLLCRKNYVHAIVNRLSSKITLLALRYRPNCQKFYSIIVYVR